MSRVRILTLFVFLLPCHLFAQELTVLPSNVRVVSDSTGRGIAELEFNLCELETDDLVVNAVLEWKPQELNLTKHTQYWVHVLDSETTFQTSSEAWQLLTEEATTLWDFNPSELARGVAKRVRLVLPIIAEQLLTGKDCTFGILIGTKDVPKGKLGLETVELKLHTISGFSPKNQ